MFGGFEAGGSAVFRSSTAFEGCLVMMRGVEHAARCRAFGKHGTVHESLESRIGERRAAAGRDQPAHANDQREQCQRPCCRRVSGFGQIVEQVAKPCLEEHAPVGRVFLASSAPSSTVKNSCRRRSTSSIVGRQAERRAHAVDRVGSPRPGTGADARPPWAPGRHKGRRSLMEPAALVHAPRPRLSGLREPRWFPAARGCRAPQRPRWWCSGGSACPPPAGGRGGPCS